MSGSKPIVVLAPDEGRRRLLCSEMLPRDLLREMTSERIWDENSGPSIYLWPCDVPYSRSEELLRTIADRSADLPAFFGMDRDTRDGSLGPRKMLEHQERMVDRILFDSVVVHILFLSNDRDNEKIRNGPYARLCSTFREIGRWSENLKKAVEIRRPGSNTRSEHILVLVSREQVVASREDIEDLRTRIGAEKAFKACYFLDWNLFPGMRFHTPYIWDVLVGRFLLALLLSQEDPGKRQALWEKPGLKLWRASDCEISLREDSSEEALKRAMDEAASLLKTIVSAESENDMLDLLDPKAGRELLEEDLKYELTPPREGEEVSGSGESADFRVQELLPPVKEEPSGSGSRSGALSWHKLDVKHCEEALGSPARWKERFAELRQARIAWSKRKKDQAKDPARAVGVFFSAVRRAPGELWEVARKLLGCMRSAHDLLKQERPEGLAGVIAAEDRRRQAITEFGEAGREFEKAQDHYVGRGVALIVMAVVTGAASCMIWQVLRLFDVGIRNTLLLSLMVFLGSAAAYGLIMWLHISAGKRAAKALMDKYHAADAEMLERDRCARRMFFAGGRRRDTMTLQHIRFKTWLLAKRVRSILDTELQPQLGYLLDDGEDADPAVVTDSPEDDTDNVRTAYLERTRFGTPPLTIDGNALKSENLKKYIDDEYITGNAENRSGSFLGLWEDLCKVDTERAGYFPARIFIPRIRRFVTDFLDGIHHYIFEKSVGNCGEPFKAAFKQIVKTEFRGKVAEESLVSASMEGFYGKKRTILFLSSAFCGFAGDSGALKEEFPSKLLEKTRIAALFFQEYNVEFALRPTSCDDEKSPRPAETASGPGDVPFGVLTFTPISAAEQGEP